jgi:phosphoribosyl-ATP pyrophosphohydrolase
MATEPACHRKTPDVSAPAPDDTLARLAAVIASRRGGDPERSYVARLFAKGEDAMLKKVGEEATEVVLAAKDATRDGRTDRLVGEMADLWFHSLVVLAAHGLAPADVLAELRRREGLSGLEEFALRKARRREDLEGGAGRGAGDPARPAGDSQAGPAAPEEDRG